MIGGSQHDYTFDRSQHPHSVRFFRGASTPNPMFPGKLIPKSGFAGFFFSKFNYRFLPKLCFFHFIDSVIFHFCFCYLFVFVLDETDIGGDVSYQQSSSRNMRAAVGGVQEKMYAQERLRREMELEMEEMHR